jgi:MYXO-CTERM domain-containing protein
MKIPFLTLTAAALVTTATWSPVFADDGELSRKSMSSSSGSETFPVPEAEHAFIDYMKFYVPAQAADGTVAPIEYNNVEGTLVETRDQAKPLVGVYIYGPIEGVDGTGFVGHGKRDAWAAVSLDDGATWKRTNLSESADKSSSQVVRSDIELFEDTDGAYPGDVVNMFHAVAGNRVIAAWPSRYCQTGTPGYTMDADLVGGYLGIDNTTDLYLTDLFGVAGSQGSVDYSEDEFEQNQPVGEVPFNCLWTARGVLVNGDDPNTTDTTEASHMVWFKPERLTSGRRDVNRVEIKMVEGAGAVVTWQEDPSGLRPGQGEGPGEGWSGAIANNQTDVWYSFLPWEHFETVDVDGTPTELTNDDGTLLYTGTEKPGHYVPFAVPMRLTNNAKCNADGTDDPYCYAVTAAPYGLPNLCAETVTIPQGQNREGDICIAESGLPNIGNTAATRPRLSLQGYDSDGDTVVDSAWVVVIAEEDKGFGRYAFEVGETGVDTATPCFENEDGTYPEGCEVADQGKNIWYYSFDMGSPTTSADTSETGLVANIVSQGNMLNQPEVDWRTGETYPPMDSADMWFAETTTPADYSFLIYRTEIARRGSLLVQGVDKAENSTSGLSAFPTWKQGLLNQGGPADVMARRIVAGDASANPYDFANIDCEEWAVDPGTNPYYPGGLCGDPAVNLSGTTPETCEASGDLSDGTCPTIDDGGITVDDPADNQVFDKMLTWYQCPGSDLCTDEGGADTNLLGSNLDDQSWYNPLEVAKGHRGFVDGDFVMILYAWSPNWKLNAVGRDRYELYIRRSFDGGETWTTTPGDWGGVGTTTCETMRDGDTSQDDSQRCQLYAAGAPEQARNVSQLKSQSETILDPRYTPTAGDVLLDGLPTYEPTDVRDPSRYFIVYETGDNTTTAEGEPEPLDLFYSRAVAYGDNYMVWSEEDDAVTACLPDGSEEFPVLDANFCNEFDSLENSNLLESGEASMASSSNGDFLYAVWSQAQHYEDTGELCNSDAMFRRVWYLDEFQGDEEWFGALTGGGGTANCAVDPNTGDDDDGNGNGNGGCSVSSGKTGVDPLLPGVVLAALGYLGLRRRMTRVSR